jgi:hypothetical protein
MCAIFEEDWIRIGEAIRDFIQDNKTLPNEQLSDDLKDHLADLKDAGKLAACGCDGPMKVTQDNNDWVVLITIFNNVTEFTISKDEITRRGVSYSDLIDDYDGWQANLNDWD